MRILSTFLILSGFAGQALASNIDVVNAKRCDYKQGLEMKADVAESILDNNSMSGHYDASLVSALKLRVDKESYSQANGAAIVRVTNETLLLGALIYCIDGNSYVLDGTLDLDKSIDLGAVLKTGTLTEDLLSGVYMGDEHVAGEGSKITIEIVKKEKKAYVLKVSLLLRVSDLTELTEEEHDIDDNAELPIHDELRAESFLRIQKMRLTKR